MVVIAAQADGHLGVRQVLSHHKVIGRANFGRSREKLQQHMHGLALKRSGSGKASRSIEEIKLVFERNKGAIYAIYNRALADARSAPALAYFDAARRLAGETVPITIPGEKRGLFDKIFARRAA